MKTVLIIGMGRFGHHLTNNMISLGNEVMIVDKDESRLEDLTKLISNIKIGDCTNEDVLRSFGVANFDICFVTISANFENSLETTSLLKELGAKIVISRAERDIQKKFLLRNGADQVVYPERQVAKWASIRYTADHILDYMEIDASHAIFEAEVPEEWLGKTIGELDVRRKYNINIDECYLEVDQFFEKRGVKKVEKFFHIENLADPENLEIQHNIILALRAHNLMFRDQDYVVKDDEVLIVDEFTGRIMPGRRYSDGLHQAIEAKEHVKVKRESKTLATITFQNLFNKFEKKAGMTGTALTEEKEFREIYGMDVIEIPTNRPVARKDLEDAVYKTKKEKFNAVCDEIEKAHANHQPVLVGTITIETSELLSSMLKRRGIKHNVLNAKYHELEAEIVAQAGIHDAVTIATNMAGRGTDIKLDDESREAGGLKIIGTERHESRRIDNQLRGRSGRQGDPGESRFYISLEDDLMRLFGSERLMQVFETLGVEEGEQIEHKMLSSAIEKAQQKIESNNFAIRKNLLEYDQVMNEQREIIYEERRRVLDGENMRDSIFHMINDYIENTVDAEVSVDQDYEDWDLIELNRVIGAVIPMAPVTPDDVKGMGQKELKHLLKERAAKAYEAKEAEFPEPEHIRELERVVLLKVIDAKWMDHIDDMDQLRQGIGLQAYGNRDPKVEYKMLGYDMFGEMTQAITETTVRTLMHVRIEQKAEREQVAKVTGTNKDDTALREPKKRENKKVYPNDPCPCGSGKKYKQCCGRNK